MFLTVAVTYQVKRTSTESVELNSKGVEELEKTLNKIIASSIFIAVLVPVFINVIMFINLTPVAGDEKTWISTLGSFWGAILGGIIAGAITLYGVRATIKSSEEGINRTLKEQRAIREEEKRLATTKERLLNLYQPASSLHAEYFYKYNAHNFSSLTPEEKRNFILLLDRNIVYGDKLLFTKLLELTWSARSK